jgi:general secretion pathway protein L
MPDTLYVRLPESPDAPLAWLRLGAEGGVRASGEDSAGAIAPGQRVIAFAPGCELLLTEVQLPTRNRARMLKAVPFALEEQLIGEVETQHFALGEAGPGVPVPVAVAARTRMDAWLARLSEAGLSAEFIIPEPLALPWEAGTIAVYLADDRLLIRHGAQLGLCAEADMGVVLIETLLGAEGAPTVERLIVHSASAPPAEYAALAERSNLAFEARPAQPLLALLAQHAQPASALNLLQGPYSAREQYARLWKPWRASAALVLACLVVAGAGQIIEHQRLSSEQARLTAEIDKLYRATFPQDKRLIQPRKQMEDHLKRLAGSGGSGFLEILAAAAPSFRAAPGFELGKLRAQPGEVEIEFTLADLQGLDKLKGELSQGERGKLLNVEIVNATSREGKVEARIKIRSRS